MSIGAMKRSEKRSGRDAAYQAVRSRIINLDLPPGAALSENELAATLGVSRTPVREAFLLLAQEGLVQVFPKVGTFVSRVDSTQVAEAQFLREAVELASLDSLRTPLDAPVIATLEDNLDRQEHVGQDLEAFFVLDEAFHRGLMELAGHETSWSFVAAAKGHLDRARMLGLKTFPELGHLRSEHRAVLDAIVAEDLPKAQAALQAHLRTVFSDIQAIEATSPELFVTDPHAQPVRRSIAVWE